VAQRARGAETGRSGHDNLSGDFFDPKRPHAAFGYEVSTPDAMRNAYKLVIERGLIRIGLPLPDDRQFRITHIHDPYGCNPNPVTGLSADLSSGFLSFYRRPLPTANLNTLTAIMWDGREPNLFHQSIDATLGHAEAVAAPTPTQQQQIVSFEGCTSAFTSSDCASVSVGEGVMAAQAEDEAAGGLDENGAVGGPVSLYEAVANFFRPVNDPFGRGFNPNIFSLYDAWLKLTGTDAQTQKRQTIARGQQVFNTGKFNISGVAGLNDQPGVPNNIRNGSCGTCHNTPNVGNNSLGMFMDIGVTAPNAPGLDTSHLPVFTVTCGGTQKTVTDLGVAMVSGKCEDIGKTKVPVLRALPGRSPYFHNGAALEIEAVVEFYNQRFNIGLSEQQKADLAAFLESL
jgi:cytochrome c peroxidase